ncbi:hypothetical protein [Paraburkholderia fungorum]|nr:hypothetical protein [Paraburkholderia fungorum]
MAVSSSFVQKSRLLAAVGIELCVALEFDRGLATSTPERFVREVLVEGLAAAEVVVGHDFAFGKDRGGNVSVLRELGSQFGFDVTQTCAVRDESGLPYSSTRARNHLTNGELRLAARILGRPWVVEGRIGETRSSHIDARCAAGMLICADYLAPGAGLYSVQVTAGNGYRRKAIASVMPGVNCSWLELHFHDDAHDLSGRRLSVEFLDVLHTYCASAG